MENLHPDFCYDEALIKDLEIKYEQLRKLQERVEHSIDAINKRLKHIDNYSTMVQNKLDNQFK